MAREHVSLLEALREDLGVTSVKDGCSPQGQCGCCTVLIDGAARVACVTPLRRAAGRRVSTVDGLEPARVDALVGAFIETGASQCGFCTPGILCRLAALPEGAGAAQVETALLAHLCRCTGWRSIVDAFGRAGEQADAAGGFPAGAAPAGGPRATGEAPATGTRAAGEERAWLEGGVAQRVGPAAARGRGGFADDHAPEGCLVAVPVMGADPHRPEGWATGETLAEARAASAKVQGRRSGSPLSYPVDVPVGDWDLTLRTTWVEPAYLEPDASWCRPGESPADPVANGGAFGGKTDSLAPVAARMLADHHGRPVRVLFGREDVVRLGPKRPPVGAGIRLDGPGVLRLGLSDPAASTGPDGPPGVDFERWPALQVETVALRGPATSLAVRAAGWAEAAVLGAAVEATNRSTETAEVAIPGGGWVRAEVEVGGDGWPSAVHVEMDAGRPLDEIVLRSYAQGAAHMALGWVCSEGIAVGDDGEPDDLTIRSFGVLRARDTPPIGVEIRPSEDPPRRAGDAVFAAVAAAAWLAQGLPPRWPTMRGTRR